MEEQIIKILWPTSYMMEHDRKRIAKEIATLVEKDYVEKEFVEWVSRNSDKVWWNTQLSIWVWHDFTETSEHITHYSTNELYKYWQENIKGK